MDKSLLLVPRMSEKAYAQSQATNTYVFDVPSSANKHRVARAVAAQFDVTVSSVRTTLQTGKNKRTVRKSGRAVAGKQSDVKKAYVTLAKGNNLPFFAAIEEETKKSEEKAEQLKKATDKAAAKEDKKAKKESK
jgi:large subunit ribosomal protein L23